MCVKKKSEKNVRGQATEEETIIHSEQQQNKKFRKDTTGTKKEKKSHLPPAEVKSSASCAKSYGSTDQAQQRKNPVCIVQGTGMM